MSGGAGDGFVRAVRDRNLAFRSHLILSGVAIRWNRIAFTGVQS
jgi:hypothetical protein